MGVLNLKAAARKLQVTDRLSITWEPFFLNRDIAPEGEDLTAHLTRKYGSETVQRFSAPNNPLDKACEKHGVTMAKNRRIFQTLTSHLLVEHCKREDETGGLADTLMDNLFCRYFERGEDLSKEEVLVSAGVDVGLSEEVVSRLLVEGSSSTDAEAIMKKDESYKRGGVSGVPFFIRGGARFSGAQPVEVFEELLEECAERS